MEIWDAYDQYGFITGLTLNRDQVLHLIGIKISHKAYST